MRSLVHPFRVPERAMDLRGPRGGRLPDVQGRVLDVARRLNYEGYSKHDALNGPWFEQIAGRSRLRRLLLIQIVMRSPLHIRPFLRVRPARNAKGLALFARALLARHRLLDDEASADEARRLMEWLIEHPSKGFRWPCWGYPYPWQDVGFYAPRHFPNRVVTSFVVQALLDGFETLHDRRFLDVAGGAVEFLLEAPRTLYEDSQRRCVSYVPSDEVDWIVMDVPALVGAAAARYAALTRDASLMEEAARLVRYVASKQTPYGAWYYSDPPSGSHITHDNYHTGFILDSLLGFAQSAKSAEFAETYARGLDFYREQLFESDGAPRFMHDRRYPFDIHGAAQGIVTFSLASSVVEGGCAQAQKILNWTLDRMYDPRSSWFCYQRRRFFRTRIRLLRWCQAWMAWAIAAHLELCGESR